MVIWDILGMVYSKQEILCLIMPSRPPLDGLALEIFRGYALQGSTPGGTDDDGDRYETWNVTTINC